MRRVSGTLRRVVRAYLYSDMLEHEMWAWSMAYVNSGWGKLGEAPTPGEY